MSFDLYLWYEPAPITDEQAMAICHRLAAGDDDAVQPNAGNLAFHTELVERFPGLEILGDTAFESSPWSMSPDATDRRVILCMSWSSHAEISGFVLELAQRHGLICFDPQSGHVHNAPHNGDQLRLELANGSVFIAPDVHLLQNLLGTIDEQNWYACLERDPEQFAQVALGRLAGVPADMFTFEYREGPGSHFGTSPIDRSEAVELLLSYAAGDLSHRDRYTWHNID